MNSSDSNNVSTNSSTTFKSIVSHNYTEPVSQSWGHTKSATFRIEHTWTIENFTLYLSDKSTDNTLIESAKFAFSCNDKIKFSLKLYPNGLKEANKGYLSIFMITLTHFDEKSEFRLRYSFSVVDRTGKLCHTAYLAGKPLPNGGGKNKFLARSLLMDPKTELLTNDKLTIHCKVRVYTDRYSSIVKGPERVQMSTMHANKLFTDLRTLLDKGTHSDVQLVIGSTQYSAHKNILSARSPVFGAMFAHEDTEENVQNRVEIIDVSVEAFQELLNYIYSGQVPEKVKLTSELLSAADKYQVDALKLACEEALSSELTVESVTSLLGLADMHNANKLKVKCVEYITEHATEVMLTKAWEQMFKTRPELALQTYRYLAVQTHPLIEQKRRKMSSSTTVATDLKGNGEYR